MKASSQPRTIEQARVELSRRLEARREEIEAAVMNRVYAVSDPSDLDPEYAEGLRVAVTAAVDYGLAAVELGEERSPPPPPILLAQARLAARAGVGLDTVLRRYFAGHALLGDFLVEEAEGGRLLRGVALQKLLRTQAALFDRLLAAVSEEHARESCERPSSDQYRSLCVERLLAGDMVDTAGLEYEFGGHHLGALARGPGAEDALRDLAFAWDRQLLTVRRGDGAIWAWLGGRRPYCSDQLNGQLLTECPSAVALAVGEPAEGVNGWRLSHRQAKAAMPVALRLSPAVVRYSDVALLAATLRDDLLAVSLRQMYLRPLERERDGGEVLRRTLRAYFSAERNISSAAAAMGVNRRTVANRLRTVEKHLGRSLAGTVGHLEAALAVSDLEDIDTTIQPGTLPA